MDIGGTNLRMGLVDRDNRLFDFTRLHSQEVFAENCDPTKALQDCIETYLASNGGAKPIAVSIGFPATVDRLRKTVLQTPNIPFFPDNYPVADSLSPKLGAPVFITRDVNGLLLYDLCELPQKDLNCVTGIYFGTGVGNAILLNGRLLLGKNGVAAELGHIPLGRDKKTCGCGNWGCLETEVSGMALESLRCSHFPKTGISDIFTHHGETEPLRDFVSRMAQVVALEVNIFDPDCVVLGGGLLQMASFPREYFESEIFLYARKPYPAESLELFYSKPAQENGVVGAGIYGFKRLDDPNYL